MDLFITNMQLFWCWWLEVCGTSFFFISCLDSHSDGTHSLQRIRWWAGDVMLNFSINILMKKQTNLHLRWPEGEYIFSKLLFLGGLFQLRNQLTKWATEKTKHKWDLFSKMKSNAYFSTSQTLLTFAIKSRKTGAHLHSFYDSILLLYPMSPVVLFVYFILLRSFTGIWDKVDNYMKP